MARGPRGRLVQRNGCSLMDSYSHAELDVAGREVLEDEDAHDLAPAHLLVGPRDVGQDYLGLSVLLDGFTITEATPHA